MWGSMGGVGGGAGHVLDPRSWLGVKGGRRGKGCMQQSSPGQCRCRYNPPSPPIQPTALHVGLSLAHSLLGHPAFPGGVVSSTAELRTVWLPLLPAAPPPLPDAAVTLWVWGKWQPGGSSSSSRLHPYTPPPWHDEQPPAGS